MLEWELLSLGGVRMGTVRLVVTIVFIIISIALTAIVLLQEGKSAGLTGSINGVADTYWGKNKGRSIEGKLEKGTKVLAVLFLVLAIVMNMNW